MYCYSVFGNGNKSTQSHSISNFFFFREKKNIERLYQLQTIYIRTCMTGPSPRARSPLAARCSAQRQFPACAFPGYQEPGNIVVSVPSSTLVRWHTYKVHPFCLPTSSSCQNMRRQTSQYGSEILHMMSGPF